MGRIVIDGWLALAQGVALQAICDAKSRDIWKALDACIFLCEDFDYFADRAEGSGAALLTTGKIARVQTGVIERSWR
jgi:hypothetical protein